MLVFGRSVEVARAVAFVLGLASALLIWLALRWLGASRGGQSSVALAAAASRTLRGSASLRCQSCPRRPLCLLRCGEPEPRRRATPAGGVAPRRRASAAMKPGRSPWCSQRSACETRSVATATNSTAGLLSLAGAAAWLAHGTPSHGSALFFVKRVSEYKGAIGAGNRETWDAPRFPSMLLRCEPESARLQASAWPSRSLGARTLLARHSRALLALGPCWCSWSPAIFATALPLITVNAPCSQSGCGGRPSG
jgi:hypothetical protein